MPYAPEYGLYARILQPLSRSHSRLRYLNWYFGRQWNRLNIIFQAISFFQPRRCRPAAACARVDRSVADVPAEDRETAACTAAGLTGCAGALPVRPLAVMAATASAGTLPVMMMRAMNRNVDVRFSDRERIKVNFRSGTSCACSTSPVHGPSSFIGWRIPPPDRACGVLAVSQDHGDRLVTFSNTPRTRGALHPYDARRSGLRRAESPKN
jgi:hypothetical protein